jgi:AcrR family transcriptional regulator
MQKADIIHAAAEIFRQKGYQAASMQDIADAVGLQKASLYHHISGKQEILLEILDQALDLLIDDMEGVLAGVATTEARLRQAILSYVRRMTHEVGLAAVLQLEHRNLEPRLRRRHIARRDRYDALWRSLVREGVESGAFRAVDEQIVTFALLGVQNWLITWYRPDGRLSPEEIADQFSDLFLSGLRGNRRPKTP